MSIDISKKNIVELHKGLVEKSFTCSELISACYDRIESREGEINAFISQSKEQAMKKAESIDKKITSGTPIGILEGIPMAIKDNILVQGQRCTAGSKILENYTAPYNAFVTDLLNESGAICLGKLNMDEFAMGSSTENSAYGVVKNPHDTQRVAGGSSGGSAAAVADDYVAFTLGSDTGGSIRQPAALCGVVGLKPTYGAVSRYGVMAMASSLDQIGPITKTTVDSAYVLNTLLEKDERDTTHIAHPNGKINIEKLGTDISELTIGVPKEFFVSTMDAEIKKSVEDAIALYEKHGATIKEVTLPNASYALATYYIIMPAEASSNLSRFDGIRYGLEVDNAQSLEDVYKKTRGQGFGKEVKRRIILGTFTLSSGYYDAYYKKAQQVRGLISRDFDMVFKDVDVLMTPTTPAPAFKIGDKSTDPLTMYLEDIYTVPVNLAGVPAISIPCGMTSEKLPIGLQIIGPKFGEQKILSAAHFYESHT